jgi:hypothetical protein
MSRNEDGLRERVLEQLRSSDDGRRAGPGLTLRNGALSEADRVRGFLARRSGGVVVDRYMAQVSQSYD